MLLIIVGTFSSLDTCDLSSPLSASRAALSTADEAALLEAGVSGCARELDDCICAALRLGWPRATRSLLVTRAGATKAVPLRIRQFAQAQADAATAFLARVHPKYPFHLKSVPALIWCAC